MRLREKFIRNQRQVNSPKIEIINHRSKKNDRFKKLLSKKNVSYFTIFVFIVAIAIYGGKMPENKINNGVAKQSDKILNSISDAANNINTSTVDEITESKVVANLAENANLAVAPSTVNSSISLSILRDSKISDVSGPVEKPKVLEVAVEKREIITYKTTAEESIQSIADKYEITAQTIKWTNNLKGDKVEAGKELKILPVDGIVYKIKENEKLDEIATKYQASAERIISYNSLKSESDIKSGTEIVIPGGILPEDERPDYVRPVAVSRRYQSSSNALSARTSSSSLLASNFNAKAGNAYAYGYCTWYVYNRRPDIGSYWGNATSWAAAARAAGFTVVQGVPKAGSIFQYGGGYGHVGIVESVNESAGTMRISDMNGIAGWGAIGYKDVSINRSWYYIY